MISNCVLGVRMSPKGVRGKLCKRIGNHSLVAQTLKNLSAMQETQVQSLGQEDLLEKGMATYSSILVWRIPGTEEPVRL